MVHLLRKWGVLGLTALLVPLCAGVVSADEGEQERIALVIGNGSYGSVSSLDNPVNDADLIAHTLEHLDFDVTLITDANQIAMKRAIAQFGRELRQEGPDTIGLFYYAGHGVQSFGTNYLLPVDASLMDAADLDLVAVEAQSVLRQMFSAKNGTNIVILDACRNNPFTDMPEFNNNGLAEMDAPTGTFLAYATAPGNVALDGLTGNSPFTKSLAGYMASPGMPIEQMFKQVRVEVLDETDGLQTPWDSSSLTRDFMFARPEESPVAQDSGEEQHWRRAQASADLAELAGFLRSYPNSVHADAAGDLLITVLEYDLGIELSHVDDAATAQAGPSAVEEKMYQVASTQGTRAAYDMYMRVFPQGVYVDLARLEVAALDQNGKNQPETPAASAAPTTSQPTRSITFIDPLVSDIPEVHGRSIAMLMNSLPLHSPVEGLPDEYWRDQSCSACHQWSEDRLCDHATRYLGPAGTAASAKPHPFGGSFKDHLRHWAAGGCQ